MRIIEINSFNFGSTGNIMENVALVARKEGFEVLTCCPKNRSNSQKIMEDQIFIGNIFTNNLHRILSFISGFNGCFSIFSTIVFLRKVKKYKPDIIHLHNLHNAYINLPLLFRYIKRNNIKILWTLHDCWPFTGKCPHFVMIGCDKWKMGCHDCPQYREYPAALVDCTKFMWRLKKKWFTGVKGMALVTPSQWLANLVKQSYLGDYPITVINNGIDLATFKPISSKFREKYCIGDKYIVLGVSSGWNAKKGLDVFIELATRLDNRFQIVLVGTDESIAKQLPNNIVPIHKTQNKKELAEIYTAADVFVNPTREDNYPTVNMEALACGTPVITFRTGGSPEIINKTCGSVVDCNDIDQLIDEISKACIEKIYSREKCLEHAKSFDVNYRFNKYVDLLSSLNNKID